MKWPNRRRIGAWGVVCGLFLTSFVSAHPILQNPMWVEVTPDGLKVKLYVSIRELSVVQGLPIAGDGAVDTALAVETAPRHSGYVLDHLSFRADGVPLSGKVTSIEPPKEVGKGMEGPDRAHFVYRLEYSLGQPPARIALSHTMVQEFPSAPGVPWDLSYTYRFGPPGAVPVKYGSIPRGVEVIYPTGFGQPLGVAAESETAAPRWLLMLGIGLLGAALGLGTGRREDRFRLVAGAALSFLAGCGLGAGLDWKMPAFLAAALPGIGIMLVSVDNIHRAAAALDRRRLALMLIFPAVAGLAVWGIAAQGPRPEIAWCAYGLVLLAGMAVVGSMLGGGAESAEACGEKQGRGAVIQFGSLLTCGAGLVVLLEGLGVRPWIYWFLRLTGGA